MGRNASKLIKNSDVPICTGKIALGRRYTTFIYPFVGRSYVTIVTQLRASVHKTREGHRTALRLRQCSGVGPAGILRGLPSRSGSLLRRFRSPARRRRRKSGKMQLNGFWWSGGQFRGVRFKFSAQLGLFLVYTARLRGAAHHQSTSTPA